MPRWLRHYLAKSELRAHFIRALLIGLFLRILSAWFVYGPQALDDYKHGVWPAYQFFAGLPLDLPDYRSHLLVWILAAFAEVASWAGITSALGQVRAMYLGLAALSLTGIWGTYLYARAVGSRLFGALALYMIAAFPLMPFVSTRAFGEAIALAFVLLGMGSLELARRKHPRRISLYTFGFIALGFATLLRFHVGLIFVPYAFALLFLRQWPGVIGALIGGLTTIGGQILVDTLSGKAPLGTLLFYLAENEGGAHKYGVNSWYNPLTFILAVSLAPFSFVLWRHLGSLWRRHRMVLIPFLIFFVAHSFVPHKEERFLYPILGIELWALAHLWSSAAFERYARRIFGGAVLFFTVLLLPIVCLVNTQEGEIEPPALVESEYEKVVYLDHLSLFGKSRFRDYFLRPPSVLREVSIDQLNAHSVDESLVDRPDHRAVVLITSEQDAVVQLESLAGVYTGETRCLDVRVSGSIIDRLIYSSNPKHNQRRRPTWYLVCERSPNV